MAYRGQRRHFGPRAPTRPEALASLRTYLASARSIEGVTAAQLVQRFRVTADVAKYELLMAEGRRG